MSGDRAVGVGGPRDVGRHLGAYRPFAIVIALLAVLIAAFPSVDQPSDVRAGSADKAATGVPTPASGPEIGPTDPGAGGEPSAGAPGTDGPGGSGPGTGVSTPTGGAPGTPTAAGAPGGGSSASSTAHCIGGRQFADLKVNPPCFPAFAGNNGGATFRGVSAETVKVIYFQLARNEQVNVVLSGAGLGADNAELDAYFAAISKFATDRFEFYGRKLEVTRFESRCPETPPDIPLCLEEARRAMDTNPFIIVEPTPLYPVVHDEFARSGFISVGGWHFDRTYFTERRPYRYDVAMNGTEAAAFMSQFYCAEMAGKGASHSGQLIHPQVGPRGTKRKLGILTQDDDARLRTAKDLKRLVAACNGSEPDPVVVTYSTDIERAQEQADGLAVKMIEERVTTVICSCDSIAPSFLMPAFTAAQYFPEHLMPGTGFVDNAPTGRLFEPNQWRHAFGLSHVGEPEPIGQMDATVAMNKGGREGNACGVCVIAFPYAMLVAEMIQAAGPNLTPESVEIGTLGLPDNGQQTLSSPLLRFGDGDYTQWSDVKVVYWDPAASSKTDGSSGGEYITVSDQRIGLGEFRGGMLSRIPPAAA